MDSARVPEWASFVSVHVALLPPQPDCEKHVGTPPVTDSRLPFVTLEGAAPAICAPSDAAVRAAATSARVRRPGAVRARVPVREPRQRADADTETISFR